MKNPYTRLQVANTLLVGAVSFFVGFYTCEIVEHTRNTTRQLEEVCNIHNSNHYHCEEFTNG